MLTSTRQERQLEPRYRRILSFGDVLDESIGLFRRHWVVYAIVSAACLLPYGLIAELLTLSGAFDTRRLASELAVRGQPDIATVSALIAPLMALLAVAGLFYLAWTAAVILTTDEYLHATPPTASTVLLHTLRRYPMALLAGLVYGFGLSLITAASMLLFAVTVLLLPLFLLCGLGATIGLVLWWVRPTARGPWLKWLIILGTPFGLPIYFSGMWSMWLPATMLEPNGPIRALSRSHELVDRHWFRVIGIVFVAGTIVSVLQYIPTLLVELPLGLLAFLRGEAAMGPTETAISTAVGIMTEILFASMASICYAVLFVDLRNRREGTDIVERLSQLELAQPLSADG